MVPRTISIVQPGKQSLSARRPGRFAVVALGAALMLVSSGARAQEPAPAPAAGDEAAKAQELAKKLSNPIASLISLPIQVNFDYGHGADGSGYKSVTNIQPVIPFSLSRDWNVLSRTILPLAYQSHVASDGNEGGLGDTTQSLFFSPKAPTKGGIVWGVGPAILIPTATDDALGAGKWAAGPTFVVLTQKSGWTAGMLANQLWSFAGSSDRDEVNSLFVQPFLAFTTKKAMTFTLNSESTYNWKASTDRWSVPVNFIVGQIIKVGNQIVSVQGGLRYWAESPANGPSGIGYRFAVILIFPK
jgi:hypothetical protein